jgi:hypothetical protein
MNSTVTQPNLLELAKQGNTQAITALMNRQLQPKGITVKASFSSGCLMVVAESQELPDQGFLVEFVCKGMINLKAKTIKRVVVRGQATGITKSVWREAFDLPSINSTKTTNLSNIANTKASILTTVLESLRSKRIGSCSFLNRPLAVGLVGLSTVVILGSVVGHLSQKTIRVQKSLPEPSIVTESPLAESPVTESSVAEFPVAESLPSQDLATQDQKFIEDYYQLALEESNPINKLTLLKLVKESPDIAIETANHVCKALKSGVSWEQTIEVQIESIQGGSAPIDAKIAAIKGLNINNRLATIHYCPEFASNLREIKPKNIFSEAQSEQVITEPTARYGSF